MAKMENDFLTQDCLYRKIPDSPDDILLPENHHTPAFGFGAVRNGKKGIPAPIESPLPPPAPDGPFAAPHQLFVALAEAPMACNPKTLFSMLLK